MILSEQESNQYYRIKNALYRFIDEKYNFVDFSNPKIVEVIENKEKTLEEIKDILYTTPNEYLFEIREKLIENPEIIEDFVKSNPKNLSKEDLEIAETWKHLVGGDFFIVKDLKKYTIFMEQENLNRIYGVVGLFDEIKDIVHRATNFPAITRTILFPFKSLIIYEGLLIINRIMLGKNISSSLNKDYQENKRIYGIIESLPYNEPNEDEDTEEFALKKLNAWMRTFSAFDENVDVIGELLIDFPQLEKNFYQNLGKLNFKQLRKQYKDNGLKNIYLGIYKEVVVAVAKTKNQVQKQVEELLGEKEQQMVYIKKI